MNQLLFMVVFGALGGALFAWLFLGDVGFFQLFAWLPKDATTQAVLGAIVGAALGARTGLRHIRRQKATQQLAEELSLNYSAKGAEDLTERMKTMLDWYDSVSLEHVCFGKTGDVKFWIGDLHLGSTGENSHTTVQTVAFFEISKFNLPQFTLKMEMEGGFLTWLSDLVGEGEEDIDFDSHPVFSKSYHLSGKPADAVRRLFQPPLLDFFSRRRGWEVRGEEKRLVVMRPGQLAATGEQREFVRDALEIVVFFREAAQKRSKMPPSDSKQKQPAKVTGGFAGWVQSKIQSNMISMEDVEAFLKAPIPRTVPSRIAEQRLAGSWFFLIWALMVGIPFLVISIVGAVIDIGFLPFSVAIMLAATTLIALPVRHRRRALGLLQHGRLTEGVIQSVKGTINQLYYLARVNFDAGGVPITATTKLDVYHVKMARRAMDAKKKVTIIYSPESPNRFILALQLTNVDA